MIGKNVHLCQFHGFRLSLCEPDQLIQKSTRHALLTGNAGHSLLAPCNKKVREHVGGLVPVLG